MFLRNLLLPLLLLLFLTGTALADDPVYRENNKYPVLDEIKEARAAVVDERDSLRTATEKLWELQAEAVDDAKQSLRVDWTKVKRPAGPEDFDQLWHLPPTPQFYTGTCWAFCSTSYMESEANRLTGVEVKLSEMWVVYWEYVEKARSYLASFGATPVAEGGQDHGTLEIMKLYGIVPRDAYPGVADDGRHDHARLSRELKGYLAWVLKSESWDEEQNLAAVRGILDKHLGAPPVDVEWEGKVYSPASFTSKVLGLDPEAYVACVSRMDTPYYSRVLLDVHDNWRRKDDYVNLPLDDFYQVIHKAVREGYTLSIGGDNSEPGMDGMFDTAIIPDWDIPVKYIDQGSREHRIVNGETGDDHGVHIVGFTRHGGRDWYLIKDSNRSSRLGQFKGYYMWSGDYLKLKMLSFTIHRDRLEGLLD